MASAYSMDLRRRVMEAYDRDGQNKAELAERFCVCPRTIGYWLKRRRETGSIEPSAHGGGPEPRLSQAIEKRLNAAVEEKPDRTLKELIEVVNEPVSVTTMWRWCEKLNLSVKKNAKGSRTRPSGRERST